LNDCPFLIIALAKIKIQIQCEEKVIRAFMLKLDWTLIMEFIKPR